MLYMKAHCTTLYCTVLHSTVLYCAVLCCTVICFLYFIFYIPYTVYILYECEGAALNFSCCWIPVCWSGNEKEYIQTSDVGCAGLEMRRSKYRLLMLGACLLDCGCEGAALNLFCCCLLVCWPGDEGEVYTDF